MKPNPYLPHKPWQTCEPTGPPREGFTISTRVEGRSRIYHELAPIFRGPRLFGSGLGLGSQFQGFRVWGFGFRVWDLVFRVPESKHCAHGGVRFHPGLAAGLGNGCELDCRIVRRPQAPCPNPKPWPQTLNTRISTSKELLFVKPSQALRRP